MNTIFWVGTHEGVGKKNVPENVLTAQVSAALVRYQALHCESYGPVTVSDYDIANERVVVIAIDNVRTGFGILCASENEAKAKLAAAQALLQKLAILATAEALKLSDGPAKAA
jgi:hypothetical protein